MKRSKWQKAFDHSLHYSSGFQRLRQITGYQLRHEDPCDDCTHWLVILMNKESDDE